jgi:hypothetical protein
MITYCPTLDGSAALAISAIDAYSEAGQEIKRIVKDGLRHLAQPKVEALMVELDQIVKESAHETLRIDAETADAASEFVSLLPWDFPLPEVSPDPDGEILFDWLGPSGKMFSASVNKTGRIAYAGRFGERSKVHGTEQLSTTFPQDILRGIARATS